jgi:hypothetical protein
MGERDFHPLSANFLLAQWLPSHWVNYAAGKRNVGRKADPADWRVARTIFVADDDKVALRYGREHTNSPYRYYWRMMGKKMRFSNREIIFKTRPEQDDAELTDDARDGGEFGEIVYAGMDWVDPAPRVNRAIGEGTGQIRKSAKETEP